MKDELLLRSFVKEVMTEAMFLRKDEKPEKKKKGQGFFSKLWSMVKGTAKPDEVSTAWIEDAELTNDIDIPDSLKEKIEKFVRDKWDSILSRTKGDEEKAAGYIKRALDSSYREYFRRIRRQRDEELQKDLDLNMTRRKTDIDRETTTIIEVLGDYSMAGTLRSNSPGNLRNNTPVRGSRGSLLDDVKAEEEHATQDASVLPKAVVAYVTKGDKILAVSRGKNLRDKNMPGGHVEPGEDPVDAAIRELREETGIIADELFPLYTRVNGGYIVTTFRVTKFHGKLRSSSEGEASWSDPRELVTSRYGNYFFDVIKST